MFFKAIVLAVCGLIADGWRAARTRYRARGIPLALDPRTGRYVARDTFAIAERWMRRFAFTGLALLIPAMIWTVWLLSHWDPKAG